MFTTGTSTTSLPATTATVPPAVDAGYRWQAGDCLDFSSADTRPPYAPYGNRQLVDCMTTHTHEVYLAETTAEGPDTDYPDPGTVVNDLCTASFAGYVGAPRVDTTLEILFYFPDADEWAAGERYRACLVFTPAAPAGTYGTLRGSVTHRAVEYVWEPEPQACLDGDLWTLRVAATLPCDHPHLLQILGDATLDDGGSYPGTDAVMARTRAECRRLLPSSTAGVAAFSEPTLLQPSEWETGQRRVVCVGAVIDDAGDPVSVVGSFLGSWHPAAGGPSA